MNGFLPSLWAETLKMRRSRVPLFTALGFSFAPLVGGLFMIILKDPEAARSMGLISAKAQLTAGVADWPTFFSILAQAVAVGGGILFAVITSWIFGITDFARSNRGSKVRCDDGMDAPADDLGLCLWAEHRETRCHPWLVKRTASYGSL
jgi:hypothetical protein